MENSSITDPLFRKAVDAIDVGNEQLLNELLMEHPFLVSTRLQEPVEGYFSRPYLLWFVADNPIRIEKLPPNIAAITKLIVAVIEKTSPQTLQHQLDYTLGLVATGRIPKECGVQIEMMELLIKKGASVGNMTGVLAHGNFDAGNYLISKGSPITLTAAVCLELNDRINDLFQSADEKERELALVAASFFGNAKLVDYFIRKRINVNNYPDPSSGFHSHATALHQAVYSGSLDCVKLLVKAGANRNAKDKVYEGTPLDWAQHMQAENEPADKRKLHIDIEKFLLTVQ